MMRLTATALASLVLAGCASFSPDGGFGTVEQLSKERIGQAPRYPRTDEQAGSAQARLAELLQQPLSADSAVEIALLNNRDLQASYAELGIAESDLVRAGRLANPSFNFGRLSGSGAVEIDRAVMFNVLGLLTMPLARQIEQGRFEQAQLQATFETVGVAGEARKAFFEAVTAQQLVNYFGQVKEAADASNELARPQSVRFVDFRDGQMRSGKIIAFKHTQATVLEQRTKRTWKIPCVSMQGYTDAERRDEQSPYVPPREPARAPTKARAFQQGDTVTFDDRDGRGITGVVVRINQRTATIGTGTAHGGTWRVPFHMLRHVLDI